MEVEGAPSPKPHLRKRGHRNRKRPNGKPRIVKKRGALVEPTAAETQPTKRQRRQQREKHPRESHGVAATALAADNAPRTREFKEVRYMGTTRAVIGPGFQVRELLFADEFASFRLTGMLDDNELAFCRMLLTDREAQEYVEHLEIHGSKSATSATPRERELTVHLNSKLFVGDVKRVVSLAFPILVVTALRGEPAAIPPPAFKRPKHTGSIIIKWATRVATGGAELSFANAGNANAFIQSYLTGQLQLPRVLIEIMGVPGDDSVVDEKAREELQKVRAKKPWLPPCMRVNVGQGHVRLFDEAKIDAMDATRVDTLRYIAKIESGLPIDLDEDALVELLRPHHVLRCRIRRGKAVDPTTTDENPEEALKAAFERRTLPLRSCLESMEHDPTPWEDQSTKHVGIRTRFSDLDKVDRVRADVQSSRHWLGMDQPCGQPVRLCVQYEFTTSLAKDLYVCLSTRMAEVRVLARNLGVDCFRVDTSGNKKTVHLQFRCSVRGILERVEKALAKAIECDEYRYSHLPDVFANASQSMRLMQWVATMNETHKQHFMRISTHDKAVWIYGEKAARAKAAQSLREWIRERQREAMRQMLQPQQPQHPRANCGVCMTPADEPVTTFTKCGHTFCYECIQPGITASNRLPLMCPVENCGSKIAVKDVVEIAANVATMVDMAVFDYVAKHPDECLVCPKTGCNQILARATMQVDHLTESADGGGGGCFIACESCKQRYCVACSETTGHAMESHAGMSCGDNQAVGSQHVERHVQFLRDRVFTLCCPHCKTAFLDFDGCMAVRCGNVTCSHLFCASCLEFSSTDSTITHGHVLQCPKNPNPGTYHCTANELVLMHHDRRTRHLHEYLDSQIDDRATRRLVLKGIAADLVDLGIEIPDDPPVDFPQADASAA